MQSQFYCSIGHRNIEVTANLSLGSPGGREQPDEPPSCEITSAKEGGAEVKDTLSEGDLQELSEQCLHQWAQDIEDDENGDFEEEDGCPNDD